MMFAAIRRNAGNVTKTVFFCASLMFVVKICGYDANSVTIGGLIGMLTFIIGEVSDSWINK